MGEPSCGWGKGFMVYVPDSTFEVLEFGDVGVFFGRRFGFVIFVLGFYFFEVFLVQKDLTSGSLVNNRNNASSTRKWKGKGSRRNDEDVGEDEKWGKGTEGVTGSVEFSEKVLVIWIACWECFIC